MNAQIAKMYVTMNDLNPPKNLYLTGRYYFSGILLIGSNNGYKLFVSGEDGVSTLSYSRFTFSTGIYKRNGNVITLTDTINDYTFIFKEDKFHRLNCIKGFKFLKDHMWRHVSTISWQMLVDSYADRGYDFYVAKGNLNRRLIGKDFNIKILDSKNILGEYEEFVLTIIFSQEARDGNVFKMYIQGVPFTSGTWKYKFGRIDLFDPYFKHTYYCYVKDDTSLYYFNFPIIHSSVVDELVLKKVH